MNDPRKILVVEDEDDHFELIQRGFEQKDGEFILERARNIREARERIALAAPVLVITDWKLPDGEGVELTGQDAFGDPLYPVVIMTSHGNEAWAVEAMKHGALDYIVKSVETLLEMPRSVQRALREWDNIVSRKQAQKLLHESEDRYRSLFEGAPDAILLADPVSGMIIDANSAACRLLGRESPELLGLHHWQIHPSEIQEKARQDFQFRAQSANRTPSEQPSESAVIRPDGSQVPVEIVTQLLMVNDKPVLQGVFRDISQRKQEEEERERLEKRLRQAQKMESIGTLAGGIAHDFNNVLTPILGYTEIVMQGLPPDSIYQESLEAVLSAGQRAKELVKQILAFSRQTEHELTPLNIYHIIKEALKLIRASIPTTIEIRQDIHPDCGVVLADPTQIHQVLMNLCTNAYHAMRDRGGVLGVALTQVEIQAADMADELLPGRYVRLEVSDTGHGMSAAIRERIFEPYFTTKAKGEGTGLGLAMTHGIVKSFHGHISVYSEVGQGTTFHIYLPLVASPAAAEKAASGKKIIGGSERILVVDDEEVIANLEKQMLTRFGYKVTAFTSSQEAWQAFQSGPELFEVVITDMTMPEMTGLELTKRILALRPEMPVIICTGFSELIDGQRAKALGAKGYVMKPILLQELTRAIRVALGDEPE